MSRVAGENPHESSEREDLSRLEILASEISDRLNGMVYRRDDGDLASVLADLDSFIDHGRRYLDRARSEVDGYGGDFMGSDQR
ncbi:MAG: hypothetical protein ACLFS8_02465 [Clostridia bacterium]